jgi:hypothetical protein
MGKYPFIWRKANLLEVALHADGAGESPRHPIGGLLVIPIHVSFYPLQAAIHPSGKSFAFISQSEGCRLLLE